MSSVGASLLTFASFSGSIYAEASWCGCLCGMQCAYWKECSRSFRRSNSGQSSTTRGQRRHKLQKIQEEEVLHSLKNKLAIAYLLSTYIVVHPTEEPTGFGSIRFSLAEILFYSRRSLLTRKVTYTISLTLRS